MGLGALSMVLLLTACSSGTSADFTVTSATVDPIYTCPRGAGNAPYDLHGTVVLHNPTSSPVTVEAVRAELTLAAVKGAWLQKIGERYEVDSAYFAPGIVPAGAEMKMKVTVPSACTNGKTGTTAGNFGDYHVRLVVVTTAGSFSIAASGDHRIVAA